MEVAHDRTVVEEVGGRHRRRRVYRGGSGGGIGAAGGLCVRLGLPGILCLATPGSPTQYAECVPPITKLWNVLATGGSFPTCTGVGLSTKKVKNGYNMTVTRSDGVTSRYALDTRYQTVTPR